MLDSMHEGVLVVSKSELGESPQFLFCNRTAQKLINRSLGTFRDCHDRQNAKKAQAKVMSEEAFKCISLGQNRNNPESNSMSMSEAEIHRSLEQIIIAQQDEPNQRYQLYGLSHYPQSEPSGQKQEKCFQIRVKSINFLGVSATAIYFFELTAQVQKIALSDKLLKQEKSKNAICSLSPERL